MVHVTHDIVALMFELKNLELKTTDKPEIIMQKHTAAEEHI